MPARRSHAPLLDIVDVSKAYGGVQALGGVSVNVHEGEVLAVVGENGAGKSTLVGVAAGRVVPDTGSVSVQGDRLLSHGPAEAMKAGIRLVPAGAPHLPGHERPGQRPARRAADAARASSSTDAPPGARSSAGSNGSGSSDFDLDTPVGDLSVVQRTFVQIARGLSPGAKVMLIDEPTAPMDDAEVIQFLSVLRALTREGMGIVYISHRLKEIFQLANRINVLRDGKLVGGAVR